MESHPVTEYTLEQLMEAAVRGGLDAYSVGAAMARLAPGRHLDEVITARFARSVRDYFIAHAPAEPQPWFQPVMPTCPTHQWFGVPRRLQQHLQGRAVRDIPTERLTHFESAGGAERECGDDYYFDANDDAIERWKADQKRERYLQWPAAWADEMLKRRDA